MHQSTALGLHCSRAKTKSTFSMKLVMNMRHTNTAHERRKHGRMEGAVVIPAITLASSVPLPQRSAADCAVYHRLRWLLVFEEVGCICRLPVPAVVISSLGLTFSLNPFPGAHILIFIFLIAGHIRYSLSDINHTLI
jgi:hypothetical protein